MMQFDVEHDKWVLVLPPSLFDELTPGIRAEFERIYGPTTFVRQEMLPVEPEER